MLLLSVRHATVEEVLIYPLKHAGPASVEAWVERRGFRHDRQFQVLDHEGQNLSTNQKESIGQIQTKLEDKLLLLSVNGMDPLVVDLKVFEKRGGSRSVARAQLMRMQHWLDNYLGLRCCVRETLPVVSRSNEWKPISVICLPVLELLNSLLTVPCQARDWRPNIILNHCPANLEGSLRKIFINHMSFEVLGRCARHKELPWLSETELTREEKRLKSSFTKNGRCHCGLFIGTRANGKMAVHSPVRFDPHPAY